LLQDLFRAPGAALVSAVAHRIPQSRLPPHGSTGALASLTTLLSFAHACVVQAACSGLHATPAPFRLGQCPPVASTPAPGSHTSSASRDHSRPVLSRTVRIAPGPFWRQSRPRFPSPRGVPATVAFNLTVPALRYGPL